MGLNEPLAWMETEWRPLSAQLTAGGKMQRVRKAPSEHRKHTGKLACCWLWAAGCRAKSKKVSVSGEVRKGESSYEGAPETARQLTNGFTGTEGRQESGAPCHETVMQRGSVLDPTRKIALQWWGAAEAAPSRWKITLTSTRNVKWPPTGRVEGSGFPYS